MSTTKGLILNVQQQNGSLYADILQKPITRQEWDALKTSTPAAQFNPAAFKLYHYSLHQAGSEDYNLLDSFMSRTEPR